MQSLNLSAPTVPVFAASAVLIVLALIGHFAAVPLLSMYQFWLAVIAYAVLCAGTLLKGL